MELQRPKVLLVGDHQHHEFAAAVQWLTRNTECSTAASVTTALKQHAKSPTYWHTVVLAQARPGQIKAEQVECIHQALPLANLIALLGSWCEGETRSGQPWPGVVRVYWHQWLARCQHELSLSSQVTSWQLPRTASPIEHSAHVLAQSPQPEAGLIAVHTRRAAFFHALADACQAGGYAAAWIQAARPWNIAGASAVLWDGQCSHSMDFTQLSEVTAGLSPVPVIALLGFPRHNDVTQAHRLGAAAVLSCPFLLPDLWALLNQFCRRQPVAT